MATQWALERGPRLFDIGLHRGERDVLVALASHTGLDGSNKAWPSVQTIAHEMGMKSSGVKKSLAHIEGSRVIKVTRDTGKHNVYQITPEIGSHSWDRVTQ
jgi:hypothetical protein